MKCGTGNHYHQ